VTPQEDADLALVARAREGEDRAFAEMLQRHKGGLYGFVRRYVSDGVAAAVVVQDTFVAAWRALGRYDPRRSFAVWLRAIALNKCRDRARRLKVRRFILGEKDEQSAEALAQADPEPYGDDKLMPAERRAVFQRAIDQLPPKLKEPLLLTYFDDLTQQEAADLLGVTVKTIETRVYRARQRLAALLDRSSL
jgi:RNA polymerase sigma-70 factor (ECF subfamily)